MNPWMLLLAASMFEVLGAHGFQRLAVQHDVRGLVHTAGGFIPALYLLHEAMQSLPAALAYAAFSAMGTLGTLMVARLCFHRRIRAGQWAWMIVVIIAIVGADLTGGG